MSGRCWHTAARWPEWRTGLRSGGKCSLAAGDGLGRLSVALRQFHGLRNCWTAARSVVMGTPVKPRDKPVFFTVLLAPDQQSYRGDAIISSDLRGLPTEALDQSTPIVLDRHLLDAAASLNFLEYDIFLRLSYDSGTSRHLPWASARPHVR